MIDRQRSGLVAELAIVVLVVVYGWFSVERLILLLLIASQSLWLRGFAWSDLGLQKPASVSRTLIQAVAAATVILVAVRFVIVPAAERLAGVPVDLSALGEGGDARAFSMRLAQAWTLAAFGEEMVFRGYMIRRILDLVGESSAARAAAILISSSLFGLAHGYQGWAGVIATGSIGALLAILYFVSRRNLWPLIVCHGLVDTVALSLIYFDRRSWLFPTELG
jgi:membrane protease YdiL (CAAX protease family)